MSRFLKSFLAALGAFSVLAASSIALANDGKCMANDRRVPENATTCRYGVTWICKDGEWVRIGSSCSS